VSGGPEGFALQHPAALWLVPLAAWVLWRAARRPPDALAWPAWSEARAAGARRWDVDRAAALCLRGAAAAALAVALAGPVERHAPPPPLERGLDMVLALDASGSMRALDAEIAGRWRTRFELAREVVARFARQRAEAGDRVGLVVFGEDAFTQSPLTRDGALLGAALERVDPGVAGEATALGDALALAVKRVTSAGRGSGAPAEAEEDETRVVVLLTDGRHNAGTVPVDVAAELARHRGVRVHTVGIGGEGEVAMAAGEGDARPGLGFERHDLDAATLERVAAHTGGRFFRAARAEDLASVYAAIDGLERAERPAPQRPVERPRPEPWLALAAGLVVVELGALRVLRRTLP